MTATMTGAIAAGGSGGDAAASDVHAWVMGAVERYEQSLLRYAIRLVGDVDLAHDAVQHTFLKLCGESRAALADRLGPWLFSVCRNRAVDHLRHSARERSFDPAVADDQQAGRAGDRAAGPVSREADPAAAAETHDLAARLHVLLAELPPAQGEVIELWCHGFAYRQIAEITGRQEGHVRVLAHRGLTRLRCHPFVRGLLADAPSPPPPRRTQEVIR